MKTNIFFIQVTKLKLVQYYEDDPGHHCSSFFMTSVTNQIGIILFSFSVAHSEKYTHN